MIFQIANKNVESLELMTYIITIDRIHSFYFISLTMNDNFNWKSHINKMSNKVYKCVGILHKLKHFVPLKTKVLLYNSLILSHMNFAIPVGAMNLSIL